MAGSEQRGLVRRLAWRGGSGGDGHLHIEEVEQSRIGGMEDGTRFSSTQCAHVGGSKRSPGGHHKGGQS
jgi:hypothetical protein